MMVFSNKHLVRTKVIIECYILEQISNYLGSGIFYYNIDENTKLAEFRDICGTIYRTLPKETSIAVVIYARKTWA